MRFLKKKRPESQDTTIDPIQRLLVESGVSQEFFNRAILGSLESFGKRLCWDQATLEAVANEGRYILSRRRNYLLPVGCEPEDLHSVKDLWTLTVWLTFLIHKADSTITIDQQHLQSYVLLPLLGSFLDATTWQWLTSNRETLEAIAGFVVRDEMNNNVCALLELMGQCQQERERVQPLPPQQGQGAPDLVEVESPDSLPPSKFELGSDFIQYICSSLEDLPVWANKVAEHQIDIESPKAFIEYAALTGLNWKHVQKGVQKLGYHVPDPNTGNVFRRVAGKSVMRLNLQGGRNV